jgi:hypothetical protein
MQKARMVEHAGLFLALPKDVVAGLTPSSERRPDQARSHILIYGVLKSNVGASLLRAAFRR